MKKYLKVILCALVLFAVVGCGKEQTITDTENNGGAKEVEKEEKKDALEAFVEENRESITKLSNSMFTVDLLARNGSLVYSFKYADTYNKDQVAAMKKSLDGDLEKNSSTYLNVLKSTRLVAPNTKSVIVEYLNGDGKVISSKEYTE